MMEPWTKNLAEDNELWIQKDLLETLPNEISYQYDFIYETAKNGEESFRSEEYSALSEIFTKSKKNLVLALGGGTLTKPESAELVKNNSIVIYLYCSEEALYKRLVKGKAKRPLLADKSEEGLREEIRQLTAKREQIYKSAANFTVDTSIWGLNRIVGQIAELLPPPSDED